MPRFIVLENRDAPDDPQGLHFDLLLEEGQACRTWRLSALPMPDGQSVGAVEIAPHRLSWLTHVSGAVSGGRGEATRVATGTFERFDAPSPHDHDRVLVDLAVTSDTLSWPKAPTIRLVFSRTDAPQTWRVTASAP